MSDNLELRMYGLVPYNISPIQQGIQFGHAVVEYGQKIQSFKHGILSRTEHYKNICTQYDNWADNWKTFIILNGGTTNNKIINGIYVGSLNNHKETLDKIGIFNVTFNEPDLGDQLTSIVFMVDERVFNKNVYPNFELRQRNQLDYNNPIFYDEKEKIEWEKWLETIGGRKNLELRNFLSNFRLA
jgi:hypothetical protein